MRGIAMHEKRKGLSAVQLLLGAFFLVAVILPLIRMLMNLGSVDVGAILLSDGFRQALINSLTVSALSTVFAVALATLLAWCLARSRVRLKGVWNILFCLPMLIPSISHGMGLVVLFGANGVITNLVGWGGNIYGFWGIVTGSVMYAFPVAFLMIQDVLKYEDSTPYEAASVLGIGKLRQFGAITLPYLRKPMISVIFATFTMIVTDYGVPLLVGGQYTTLPVVMYQDVIGLLDFGKGSVIGLVLLLPAFVAFLVDTLNRDRGNASFVIKPFEIAKNGWRDAVCYVICILVSLFVLLPIAAFALLTFVKKYPLNMTPTLDNITRAFSMHAGDYLVNSLLISLGVAVVGVIVAFVTAYLTARTRTKAAKALHLMSITSLAIPGLVLGLSYVLFFKGSWIYGTMAILILVNLMHFFASPYLMMYNTLGKLNGNLEAVGSAMGISRLRIVLDVLLPQSRMTMAEMFSYFFVNSMMTISAVSFLSTAAIQPIALMITSFEAQMMLECAAFVSLIILAVNLLIKGGVYLYKRHYVKREG
jgi:iron(III) transport system permease protein